MELADEITALAEAHAFSGVVRVDRGDETVLAAAFGLADRASGRRLTQDTRLALASVTKTFTAMTVVSLVVDGTLSLTTTARSLLGDDLPMIDDAVTIEQLLAHRSGIGDYLDEDAVESIADYVLAVPVHRLDSAEAYLAVLDGHPQTSPPGTSFVYNNGGYVVLAILSERAAGAGYHDLVAERVGRPAGATTLGFARSDSPAADLATGYLDATGPRTNALHLPLLGVGDGGTSATVDDVHRVWRAFLGGRIVPAEWVVRMTAPNGDFETGRARYGLGFWLDADGPGIEMEGYDAGISARSHHDPAADVTWTVVSNWSDGAWPVANALPALLAAHGLLRAAEPSDGTTGE